MKADVNNKLQELFTNVAKTFNGKEDLLGKFFNSFNNDKNLKSVTNFRNMLFSAYDQTKEPLLLEILKAIDGKEDPKEVAKAIKDVITKYKQEAGKLQAEAQERGLKFDFDMSRFDSLEAMVDNLEAKLSEGDNVSRTAIDDWNRSQILNTSLSNSPEEISKKSQEALLAFKKTEETKANLTAKALEKQNADAEYANKRFKVLETVA